MYTLGVDDEYRKVFRDLDRLLPTEEACERWLERRLWPVGVWCPRCGERDPYTTKRGYRCRNPICRRNITLTGGSYLDNSNLSSRIQIAALYIVEVSGGRVNRSAFARAAGIAKISANRLFKRLGIEEESG